MTHAERHGARYDEVPGGMEDETSKDFDLVDYAFSEHMLRGAGHLYRVRFNMEPRNPRITEVLEELPDV